MSQVKFSAHICCSVQAQFLAVACIWFSRGINVKEKQYLLPAVFLIVIKILGKKDSNTVFPSMPSLQKFFIFCIFLGDTMHKIQL